MAEEEEERVLTKEEQDEKDRLSYAWLQPSPTYVDFHAANLFTRDQILRITFGEHIRADYPPIYRLSVAIPLREARKLQRTLARIISEEDKRIAEKDAAPKEPPSQS